MALHNALTSSNLHKTYPWSYANATARTGATGFSSGDLGHLALQLDDYSLWILTATTPTWKRVDYDSSHTHSNATTSVAGFMAAADKTKLDGIETSATADQSANEILTALLGVDGASSLLDADLLDGQEGSYYRNAGNLNAGTLPALRFDDTAHGSRSGGSLHANASAEAAGFMSASDFSKLAGIEAAATADMSANEILTALLGVDGTGSGLDADKLDGNEASAFLTLTGGTLTGSLQVIPPSTLYSSASNYNIGGASAPMGILYTHGSYRTSLMSNGYRNSSGTWTSFEINSYTGASGIELDPQGYIYMYADASKVSGDAYTIDRVVSISPRCVMIGSIGPTSNVSLYVDSARTGATSVYQVVSAGENKSDVTAGSYSFHSQPGIAADAAVGTLVHYNATQGTYSGTVNYQYGFLAPYTLVGGATNNIAFSGQIPSTATGAYNLYMSGSANNYLLGNTGIGGLPDSTHKLKLTGSQIIYNSSTPSASITDGTIMYAADIAAGHRVLHIRNENDTIVKLYQQTFISSPSADSASLKTAVDAIRTLLINSGQMAAS